MTCNVFSGTLNLTQPYSIRQIFYSNSRCLLQKCPHLIIRNSNASSNHAQRAPTVHYTAKTSTDSMMVLIIQSAAQLEAWSVGHTTTSAVKLRVIHTAGEKQQRMYRVYGESCVFSRTLSAVLKHIQRVLT